MRYDHPDANGSDEYVNKIMAQMLEVAINRRHDDRKIYRMDLSPFSFRCSGCSGEWLGAAINLGSEQTIPWRCTTNNPMAVGIAEPRRP